MIPTGLTEEHIYGAAAQMDREGVPKKRRSVHYDLVLGSRRYPPKYVIFLATIIASDKPPIAGFNAVEAINYFRTRGYEIVDRREEAEKAIIDEDDESDFPEGRERFRLHRSLERDGKISKKAKAKRLAETGKLECDVCCMDFVETYGVLGMGFIEAHHTVPVATLSGKGKTKISELALVCSNCHRMLHRGKELLTITQLRTIVKEHSISNKSSC